MVHLLDNPYFEILRHDVVQPIHVEVDEIYNLACPASPVHYQRDPVKTTVTSVSGAIHVLDLAHRLMPRYYRLQLPKFMVIPRFILKWKHTMVM